MFKMGIYVNGEHQDLDYVLSDSDKLENELIVIRRWVRKNTVFDLLSKTTKFGMKNREDLIHCRTIFPFCDATKSLVNSLSF